jgi:hypothetical protein
MGVNDQFLTLVASLIDRGHRPHRILDTHHSRSTLYGREKIVLALPRIEPIFLLNPWGIPVTDMHVLWHEGSKEELWSHPQFSTLKIEVIRSSETSLHIHTTRRYIPEGGYFLNCRCENCKSYKYIISQTNLRGPSSRANYTDRATAAFRRSYCQILWIESVGS